MQYFESCYQKKCYKFKIIWSTYHKMTALTISPKLNGNHILMANISAFRCRKCYFLIFAFFMFFEVLIKFYYVTNILIYILLTIKRRSFYNFLKFPRKWILFIFSKWKKYYNLIFDYAIKMWCCALC